MQRTRSAKNTFCSLRYGVRAFCVTLHHEDCAQAAADVGYHPLFTVVNESPDTQCRSGAQLRVVQMDYWKLMTFAR